MYNERRRRRGGEKELHIDGESMPKPDLYSATGAAI
jgi:hypothetical protein